MKRTIFSVFTSIAAIVFLGACDQHSWEDTKHLTEPHGDHGSGGHGHDKKDGDGHEKESGDGHTEKKGH